MASRAQRPAPLQVDVHNRTTSTNVTSIRSPSSFDQVFEESVAKRSENKEGKMFKRLAAASADSSGTGIFNSTLSVTSPHILARSRKPDRAPPVGSVMEMSMVSSDTNSIMLTASSSPSTVSSKRGTWTPLTKSMTSPLHSSGHGSGSEDKAAANNSERYQLLFSSRILQNNHRLQSLRANSKEEKGELLEDLQECNDKTLAEVLQPHKKDFRTLEDQYPASHELAKGVFGIVPNAYAFLELFPPAFETYNLCLVQMLNLPFLVYDMITPDRSLVGFAAYCTTQYCQSSYSTVFAARLALRTGLSERAIKQYSDINSEALFGPEKAISALLKEMNQYPYVIKPETRERFVKLIENESTREWILLAVGMMANVSTMISALELELEPVAVDPIKGLLYESGWCPEKHERQTLGPFNQLSLTFTEKIFDGMNDARSGQTGKSSSMHVTTSRFPNLRLLKSLPSALADEHHLLRGIPKAWPEMGKYLKTDVGHSFHFLKELKHPRVARTLAATISVHLNVMSSFIDPDLKYMMGIIYAGITRNPSLEFIFLKLIRKNCPDVSMDKLELFYRFGLDQELTHTEASVLKPHELLAATGLSVKYQHILEVSKACAIPSPNKIPLTVVRAAKTYMSPTQLVELVSWLGVLAMLHRLCMYYLPEENPEHCQLSVRCERKERDEKRSEKDPVCERQPSDSSTAEDGGSTSSVTDSNPEHD